MPRIPPQVGWPLLGFWTYGVLYYSAQRSVYHPLKFPAGLWHEQARCNASDVWLRAKDGVKLHAWWAPAAGPRLATLFLHGNAGNLTHRAGNLSEITAAGSSVLLLDYRGYGKSEGRPSEKGLYADADAAYDYLVSAGYPPDHIVVHGESLGTAVAVDLASRRPCAGVVLEAAFPSARAIAARVLPVLGPLLIWSFDSRRKIACVRAPLLVVHGELDETVPIELGRALFAAAPGPKSFWAVPAAGHNDLLASAGPAYRDRLRTFYAGLAPTVSAR